MRRGDTVTFAPTCPSKVHIVPTPLEYLSYIGQGMYIYRCPICTHEWHFHGNSLDLSAEERKLVS